MKCFQSTLVGGGFAVAATMMSALVLATSASALTPAPDEKEKLKACEQKLCSVILKKEPATGDLACSISKTWEKSKIVNGVKEKKISWTFGDARCGVDLKVANADIVAALTKPTYELKLAPHTISCLVERSEGQTDVKITMAPKIAFKDGKSQKAWLNVSKIDAPTFIKGAIWTVTKIEDNFGLFHSQMISEINEFIGTKCAKRYGG